MKKIILVTSGQPSLNPRLVKEADALAEAGYNVTVIYAYWNRWGTEFDKELLVSKKWKAELVGGDPNKKPITYFLSKLIHKAAKFINQKTDGGFLEDLAITRSGFFLIRAAKRREADLYIGHNLGALPAVVKAAKKHKKLCGFDAEDFHRNEVSNDSKNHDVVLKASLEDRYFSEIDYLSTSSPLINDLYKRHFPEIDPIVILNTFSNNSSGKRILIDRMDNIKLFWFSQTIGANRGLEDIVAALEQLGNYPFELHLVGNLPGGVMKNYFDELITNKIINITVHPTMPSDQIIAFASQFDIGLALEPAFCINNDLALSNKIFTYLQGGLAVIASDTQAQTKLFDQFPMIGKTYQKGNISELVEVLLFYHLNRKKLLETRQAALNVAEEQLNWENDKIKFLNQVKQTLASN